MDRIQLVITSAFLYSSSAFAVDEGRASEGFQYALATYHEDGFDDGRPIAWKGKYGQPANVSMTTEEGSPDYSPDRKASVQVTNIGFGVAPYYASHGVFRTSSSDDKSTYIAVGFVIDELAEDEAGLSGSRDDNTFSYGFGINNSSYNIEYMMSVDESNLDLSAISVGFTSAF
jgi:hypothetical protein